VELAESFEGRLAAVEERIASACSRCGRPRDGVTLVAVSKKFGPDAVSEAADCGVGVFGENRVQEARHKVPLCPGQLEWHMVGHLQRNKVREAVRLFGMIHSVDSIRLLDAVNEAAADEGVTMPVCVQVNVAGESSKFGLDPAGLPALLEHAASVMNVDVVGLMTMPPFAEEPEDVRPFFARLRELRDRAREETGFDLPGLSMGMSHDFEVAVEEGATWIRLGTVLFGRRPAARKVGD
jgi:PLP dependent protein